MLTTIDEDGRCVRLRTDRDRGGSDVRYRLYEDQFQLGGVTRSVRSPSGVSHGALRWIIR